MEEKNPNITEEMPAETESVKNDPIDGSVDILVDPDYTIAHMKLHTARFGGKQITYDDVMSEINSHEIKYGIDEDVIRRTIKNKKYGELIIIGEWTPPVDGENGYIEYLFDKQKEIKPKRDEFGIVDFRDLGHIVPIARGTTIAQITLETPGTDGMNLKGAVIRAVPGRAVKFKIGKNTGVTNDGKQLVALKDGHIFFSGGCFVVEEVVTVLQDVDISIGNIIYDGDILIRGDVCEGFKVVSKKSVTVNGNVMGGEICADANVTIKNGCINSKIKAGGVIKAGFCENSEIECGSDIESKALVSSYVKSGGEIRTIGNKGIIKGGRYTSQKSVISPIVGSETYVVTEFNIGDNAALLEKKTEAQKQLKKEQEIFDNAVKNIEYLRERKARVGIITTQQEMTMKKETQNKLQAQVKVRHWTTVLQEIEESYQNKDKLCLSCSKQLYPGTRVTIHHLSFDVKENYSRSKVVMIDNEIVVVPI